MNMTINIQSNEWILVNPDLLGFFRTNYDKENWKKIIQQFKIDHQKFSIVERAGLIDDALNLARPSKSIKKKKENISNSFYSSSSSSFFRYSSSIINL
jgi:aminopeptidase N